MSDVKSNEATIDEGKWDVKQVAKFLGMSKQTVWRWYKSGKLPPGKRLGDKAVRWEPNVIREWWNDRPSAIA